MHGTCDKLLDTRVSPQKYFFLSHPLFDHLVTCCVPCSITDSEAVLNCVVPNPGNSNWQPHTSLFTSRQQLSLLMEVSSPDVCNSRCWRFGGIRNRVSQLSSATQLARRPTAVHQTLGRTEAGCRESRTIKDLRTEKNCARNCVKTSNGCGFKGKNSTDRRERSQKPSKSTKRKIDE